MAHDGSTDSEPEMEQYPESHYAAQDSEFDKGLRAMSKRELAAIEAEIKGFKDGTHTEYNSMVARLKQDRLDHLRQAEFYHACQQQEIEEEFKHLIRAADRLCRDKIAEYKSGLETDIKHQLAELAEQHDPSDQATKSELSSQSTAVKRTIRTRREAGKRRGGRRGKEEDPILRKKKRKTTAAGPPVMRMSQDQKHLKDWEINDDLRLFTNKGSVRQRRAPQSLD